MVICTVEMWFGLRGIRMALLWHYLSGVWKFVSINRARWHPVSNGGVPAAPSSSFSVINAAPPPPKSAARRSSHLGSSPP
jgi:hypothetical protein